MRLPLRNRISSLPAARLNPCPGSTSVLISGLAAREHMSSNVSCRTLKCCAVHTMRMRGIVAARWIAIHSTS